MIQVADLVDQSRLQFVAVRLVTARLHQPIYDVEPKSRITKSRLLIDERSPLYAAYVPALLNGGFYRGRGDADLIRRLDDLAVSRKSA